MAVDLKAAKRVQEQLLQLYKEFKRICDKHNLSYVALGGTTMGAIMWKGFIEWDDDMDIGMPIDDLEKFKKICKKELPEWAEFLDLIWLGGKIHNKKTTLLEATCLPNTNHYYGIYIDIIPLIGVPNDPVERDNFLSDMRTFCKESFLWDHYPALSEYNKTKLVDWKDRIVHSYPIDSSDKYVEFSFGYYFLKDTEGLKSPIVLDFEDTTIPVSSTYDADLKAQYGGYTKYPPEEVRVAHFSNALLDFKTPYQEYIDKYNVLPDWAKNMLSKKQLTEGSIWKNSFELQCRLNDLQNQFNLLKTDYDNINEQLRRIKDSKLYKIRKAMLRKH